MDKVYLKDIEIFANHGVFIEEKHLGQKFILSLELSLDFKEAAKNNDLTKSVHYGELCHKVEAFVKEECYDLIETVVTKVAYLILDTYEIVKEVKVHLKKPWAPIGSHLEYAAVETTIGRHTAHIAIGSNMGVMEEYLRKAIEEIDSTVGIKVKKVSRIIKTKPWGNVKQDDYLNGAMEIETYLTPRELMTVLLEIEKDLERVREVKWGPRTIDLDVILYDDIISNDSYIIVPHPLMHLREFVLEPLNEIAPYALHPLKNKRVFELLEELKEKEMANRE